MGFRHDENTIVCFEFSIIIFIIGCITDSLFRTTSTNKKKIISSSVKIAVMVYWDMEAPQGVVVSLLFPLLKEKILADYYFYTFSFFSI